MKNLNIEKIKKDVEKLAIEFFGELLDKVILYGSFARGDYDEESDVDFAVFLNIEESKISNYMNEVTEITSKLSIKYGIIVSLILVSNFTFDRYKDVLPFYKNLVKEGKVVYG
ncbi:MAG: nucleotidyltransferase domain-containing protein [Ignavibacterium sp.]